MNNTFFKKIYNIYNIFSHFYCKIFIYFHGIGAKRQTRGSGGDRCGKIISTCLSSLRNQGIWKKTPYLTLIQVCPKETYLPAYLRDFIIKQTQILNPPQEKLKGVIC